MSLAYRILYRVGFTPWEQMAKSMPIVEQISAASQAAARVARAQLRIPGRVPL
jgi:hypothetical protein